MKQFEKDHSISDAIGALRKAQPSSVYITDLPKGGHGPEHQEYFRCLEKDLTARMRRHDLLMIVIDNPKL